ncbi:nucleotidyltransferase domain-containing protein [Pleomorphomonas sp. JP5]|uniref:nucleotidyltransferase domain-containing protein n=1 Tax=Pleomorphomonas sp. JP5 TaxID=2942998 RepID=UPI002043452F|nr:nucleotidyltransferase domain-containing protein [Pleomorphomonas sp. JP5]MCM5557759.1 nucleotidyltransferase domain-containing protein [Pleomorphomonas sp. JP5]
MIDPLIELLVPALSAVPGIDAVVLGGSRARGDATAESDYDIGLYFRADAPFDVRDLREAVAPHLDAPDEATITEIGEWGRWIVGGGWLRIGGQAVDLLYRDADRVAAVIDEAGQGILSVDYQPGHPHCFVSSIWLAEIHHCLPLADPNATIARLKQSLVPYPPALRRALIERFSWEIDFAAGNAAKAISRNDRSYIAGSIFRALACAAQVIAAINGVYVMNEKGALRLAGALPVTPADLPRRVDAIWDRFALQDYQGSLETLSAIARDVRRLAGA